jgi:type IV pilus assembly protein PilA
VELMIVVAIVGVLAALAVYGVRKYVSSAKTAEARNGVGQIAKGAQAAFAADQMEGNTLSLGGTVTSNLRLCQSATAVPTTDDSVLGRKYQSRPSEWQGNWDCLRFSISSPQYYQYNYTATGTGDTGSTALAVARGNLDGDAIWSTISLAGTVAEDAGQLELTFAPALAEQNAEE